MSPPPPSLLERYRLLERAGRGSSGEVLAAEDLHLGRPVAVKLLSPTQELGQDQERFRREVALLQGLRHPRVVGLLDADLDADPPWLVMPLVEAPSLREELATGALPPLRVVALLDELLEALEYLHAEGICHRDLKPENVLVTSRGAVLIDLGIALELGGDRFTETGQITGTATYLSPERLRGEPSGPRDDLYALGLVAWECLAPAPRGPTGEPVEATIRARLAGTECKRAERELRDVGPLGGFVLAMLEPDPRRRPADASAARRLLVDRGAPEASPAPAALTQRVLPSPPTPRPRRRRLVALVALAGLGATVALRSLPKPAPAAPPTPAVIVAPPADPLTTALDQLAPRELLEEWTRAWLGPIGAELARDPAEAQVWVTARWQELSRASRRTGLEAALLQARTQPLPATLAGTADEPLYLALQDHQDLLAFLHMAHLRAQLPLPPELDLEAPLALPSRWVPTAAPRLSMPHAVTLRAASGSPKGLPPEAYGPYANHQVLDSWPDETFHQAEYMRHQRVLKDILVRDSQRVMDQVEARVEQLRWEHPTPLRIPAARRLEVGIRMRCKPPAVTFEVWLATQPGKWRMAAVLGRRDGQRFLELDPDLVAGPTVWVMVRLRTVPWQRELHGDLEWVTLRWVE